MRVPANRPAAHLWYLLAVLGLGGAALVGQVLYFGSAGPFLSPPLLVAIGVASTVMLAVGAVGIARVNREMKAWLAGDHPWVREDVAARMGPVLARWSYAPDEWAAFTEREYRLRSREAWDFGAAAAVVGGVAAAVRAGVGWIAAATAAAMFVVGVASWRAWALRMRRRNRGVREPSVVIASNAVLAGGRRDYLGDERCRTSSVRFVEDETPPVLEIIVSYPGRVLQEHTMRVPVPRGREEEARGLVELFRAGRWSSPLRPVETQP